MKLSKLFAVLVVLSMLLTACGQAAPATVVEEPVATDAPAAEALHHRCPSNQTVNLTLSFWGSDLDTQVYQERVNMFMEKNPDIKVELLYIPSDYSQKVQTMIAGGTAPDVIQLSEDVHSYSSKGQVISLNDFVAKDGLDLKVRYGESGGLTTAYSLTEIYTPCPTVVARSFFITIRICSMLLAFPTRPKTGPGSNSWMQLKN